MALHWFLIDCAQDNSISIVAAEDVVCDFETVQEGDTVKFSYSGKDYVGSVVNFSDSDGYDMLVSERDALLKLRRLEAKRQASFHADQPRMAAVKCEAFLKSYAGNSNSKPQDLSQTEEVSYVSDSDNKSVASNKSSSSAPSVLSESTIALNKKVSMKAKASDYKQLHNNTSGVSAGSRSAAGGEVGNRNQEKKQEGGRSEDKNEGGLGEVKKTGGRGGDKNKGGRGEDKKTGGRGEDKNQGGRGEDKNQGGQGEDKNQGGRGEDKNQGGRGEDKNQGGRGEDKNQRGRGEDKNQGGRGEDKNQGSRGEDKNKGVRGEVKNKRGRGEDKNKGGEGEDKNKGGRGEVKNKGGRGEDKNKGGVGEDKNKRGRDESKELRHNKKRRASTDRESSASESDSSNAEDKKGRGAKRPRLSCSSSEDEEKKAEGKGRGGQRNISGDVEEGTQDGMFRYSDADIEDKGLSTDIPGVLISMADLDAAKRTRDAKCLGRALFRGIFSQEALLSCSLAGGKAHGVGSSAAPRPPLDQKAVKAILAYVIQRQTKKGWKPVLLEGAIKVSLRVMLTEMRHRAKKRRGGI